MRVWIYIFVFCFSMMIFKTLISFLLVRFLASKVTLRQVFKDGLENKFPLVYEYDMGDSWMHRIKLEKIFEDDARAYPKCLAGSRACPPEDCGGVDGFKRMVKILENPKHKEYAEFAAWLKDCSYKKYDPKHFDPKEVRYFR